MKRLLLLLPALAIAFTACQTEPDVDIDGTLADTTALEETDMTATAQISPTEGNTVSGLVTFTEEGGGVRVQGTIRGLTPGEHGFHIHQGSSCDAADSDDPDSDPEPAGAAGPHWDPMTTNNHAGPDSTMRHAGDMGNITAGDDSTATVDMMLSNVTIEGQNGVVNHAVVVHSGQDDLTSDPSGNSGGRVACGVVQMGDMGMDNGMMTDTTGGMREITDPATGSETM